MAPPRPAGASGPRPAAQRGTAWIVLGVFLLALPLGEPTVDGQAFMWADIIGECTLDGACAESPNYPQPYGSDQSCTLEIDLALAAPIVVESFDTESYVDALTVNGAAYSGTSGPSGVIPSTSLQWTSAGTPWDEVMPKSGWRLCVEMPTPAPPTPVPTTPQALVF